MAKRTIILVDDDSDDRYFMQQAIEACEIPDEVIEAESVPELINLLQVRNHQDIALIIIDMNMPILNGLDAMPHIRSVTADQTIPVVMMSTSPSPELEAKAYKAGVASFMAKPNTFEEFGTLMQKLQEAYLS